MPIRLVVSDLDGTLLSPEREISDEAVELIRKIRGQGIRFALITGRPWCSTERFARRLGLDGPAITCNGAVICDGYRTLWREPLCMTSLRELLEQAAAAGVTALFSREGKEYALRDTDWTRARPGMYTICPPEKIAWQEAEADKVNLFGSDPEKFRALLPLLDALGNEFEVVCYDLMGCEITAKGVNKARALAKLAEDMDVDLSQVLAVGDNENDLDMLREAGVGAAVGNATPAALDAADYICNGTYTAGVVEAIRKFCEGVNI